MRAWYSRIGFTATPLGVIRVSALGYESYPRGSPHRKSNLDCPGQARRVDWMNNPYRPWLESSMGCQGFWGGLGMVGR